MLCKFYLDFLKNDERGKNPGQEKQWELGGQARPRHGLVEDSCEDRDAASSFRPPW